MADLPSLPAIDCSYKSAAEAHIHGGGADVGSLVLLDASPPAQLDVPLIAPLFSPFSPHGVP